MPNVENPIRLLLVDDHPVVLEGLEAVLARYPECEVVATASSGTEALSLAAAVGPDVVLLDLQIPAPAGPELINRLREITPGTRVLIVTAKDDDAELVACMQAGSSGFLLKGCDAGELIEAIRSVHAGEIVLSANLTGRLVRRLITPAKPTAPPQTSLTPREQEALELLVRGGTNVEIARRMYVSTRTVKAHLASIFAKLGVRDRTAAVAYAIRAGIVNEGQPDSSPKP